MSNFMQQALDEAWKYQLHTYPNPAVGATVVKNDVVLSVEAHKIAGCPHAEVEALKSAYLTFYPNSKIKNITNSNEIHNFLAKNHNDCFNSCEIYVTLEPCNHTGKTPPCAKLLCEIGIKKVYIGSLDSNKSASGGVQRMQDANIDVEVGISQKDTDNLLLPFKLWQKKNFTFFKLAIREDGSITGGYITTQESLNKVHQIRTKLDLLVIGGNTVRIDRPTLDSRFSINKKASNILIYSKEKDFDKNIPLFKVPNRTVTIDDRLDKIEKSNFIMIEGGYKFFEAIKDKIDCLVLFISHKEKKDILYDINKFNMKIIYSYMVNEYDEIIFLYKGRQ